VGTRSSDDYLPSLVGQISYVNPKKIVFVKGSGEKYFTSVFRKTDALIGSSRLDCRGAFGQSSPDVERGMRWTRAHCQTCNAGVDGEVVWFWRPWAGAKSASDDLQMTVTNKVMDTGKSTKQR